jgi:hypothetical protein
MATIELPVLILNPHVPLAQAAEAHRPKVDVPDPVVDLLQADVFADADRGDVDPPAAPPNAAVGGGKGGSKDAVAARATWGLK